MEQKIVWHTAKRKLSDLKPCEWNPRSATEKQYQDLDKSLTKFNLADPIIINVDNKICGGHFRYKILKDKHNGKDLTVDVRVPNRKLTDAEMRELNIRLNKNTGEFNYDLLANFDETLLTDAGFESEEIDEIFGLIDLDDELKVENLKKEVKGIVKEGDIYQLGEQKIICGNTGDKKVWQKLMRKERWDFMFTDPPYRIEYGKRKTKTKEGFGYKRNRKYDGIEKAGGCLEYDQWLSIAKDFGNSNGNNVMIFEYWKNTPELWAAISKYWKIRNMIIWHTNNRCSGFSMKYGFFNKYDIALLSDNDEIKINEKHEEELNNFLQEKGEKLLNTYEVILYAKQGKAYWERKKGKFGYVTDVLTSEVGNASNSSTNLVFGTKPLKILVPYIKVLSPRNGIVIEPYSGSGSTLLACEIMKRKCRAIELSEINTEITILRWEKYTGLKSKKI